MKVNTIHTTEILLTQEERENLSNELVNCFSYLEDEKDKPTLFKLKELLEYE